jgi:hypothetical protein
VTTNVYWFIAGRAALWRDLVRLPSDKTEAGSNVSFLLNPAIPMPALPALSALTASQPT